MASGTWMDMLTSEESARINRRIRDAGFALSAWDSRQQEFAVAYKPARTIRNVDRTDRDFKDAKVVEALSRWDVAMDQRGIPWCPDRREEEKNCESLVGYMLETFGSAAFPSTPSLALRLLTSGERLEAGLPVTTTLLKIITTTVREWALRVRH